MAPALDSPFSLEYIASVEETALELKAETLILAGQNPVSMSVLRDLAKYPMVYDDNAVFLGEFDFVIRKKFHNLRFLSVWNEAKESTLRFLDMSVAAQAAFVETYAELEYLVETTDMSVEKYGTTMNGLFKQTVLSKSANPSELEQTLRDNGELKFPQFSEKKKNPHLSSEPRTPFVAQGAEDYEAQLRKIAIELGMGGATARNAARRHVLLGRTPVVLRQVMGDLGDKPFRQTDYTLGSGGSIVLKGLNEHPNSKHSGIVPMRVLLKLPSLLADPVAIFRSSERSINEHSYVVVLDAEVDGNPVVLAVTPFNGADTAVSFDDKNYAKGRVHLQTTVFPATQDYIQGLVRDGLLRYVNDTHATVQGEKGKTDRASGGLTAIVADQHLQRGRQNKSTVPEGNASQVSHGYSVGKSAISLGTSVPKTQGLFNLTDAIEVSKAPVATKTSILALPQAALSESNGSRAPSGLKAIDVLAKAKSLIALPQKLKNILTVGQSVKELPAAVQAAIKTAQDPDAVQAITLGSHVYMITDHIEQGNEIAVFLHEVGVHLGLENILGTAKLTQLANTIRDFVYQKGGKEAAIAERAIARAEQSSAYSDAEVVAYFVEEAVKAGIDPTKTTMASPLGRLLHQLVQRIKTALKKLGFTGTHKLTAKDIVALAHGAANSPVESAGQATTYENTDVSADAASREELLALAKTALSGSNAHKVVRVAPVQSWVSDAIRTHTGVDAPIDKHTASMYAVRHTFDKHGYEGLERARGQLSITEADIAALPSTIENADSIILGIKNKRNQELVFTVKSATDGTTLIVEEVREKRGELALVSMRKVFGTKNAEALLPSVLLYVRNDTEQKPIVVHAPSKNKVQFSEASRAYEADPSPAGFFAVIEAAKDLTTDTIGALKRHSYGWLTLDQLAASMKRPVVDTYIKSLNLMQQTSKSIIATSSPISQRWSAYDSAKPAESALLSHVMIAATNAEYDPDVLEQEKPTTPEQVKLRADFLKLSLEGQKLYRDVRDDYQRQFDMRKEIARDLALKSGAAKDIAEFEENFAQRKGPYFRLMRIGKFYSVGMSPVLSKLMNKQRDGTASKWELARIEELKQDEKHFISQAFDKESQSKHAARKFQKTHGVSYYNTVEVKASDVVASMPNTAKIDAYITKDLDPKSAAAVRDALSQMMFDLLPKDHALKQQMHRIGVAGAEQNMHRVYAATVPAAAHYISRIKHTPDVQGAMAAIREDARQDIALRDIQNELQKRTNLAYEMDTSPLVDRLMGASYMAHLGLSPAFLITNLTQVPMLTLPWLSARYGFGSSTGAVRKAYKDTYGLIKSSYGKDGVHADLEWEGKLSDDEADLFRQLTTRNLLDITIEQDFGAVVSMENTKLDKVMQWANAPVRITELMNRSVTGLAAYRLAIAKGATHQEAVVVAANALADTQFNYSGMNAPRHMQSVLGSKALARLMFQFRKYQQAALYLVVSNIVTAVKGVKGTEEQKAEAKVAAKTVAGLFGMTGLMAGAVGLPLSGSVMAIANMIGSAFGDEDDPFDAETALRNYLADTFGPEVGRVLAKGLPTLAHMDMSQRVGMGDLASPLPFTRDGKSGVDKANNLLAASAGAAFGSAAQVWDGIIDMSEGRVRKGFEKTMPAFAMLGPVTNLVGSKGVSNLVKAERINSDGLTNKRGKTVVPAEDFGMWDIALKAVGFSPKPEWEYYAANNAEQSRKQAAKDAKSRLLADYAQTKLKGGDVSDIDAAIKAYNSRHPEKGSWIDVGSKLRAVEHGRKEAKSASKNKQPAPRTGAARFAN